MPCLREKLPAVLGSFVRWLPAALLVTATFAARAEAFSAKVIVVLDGDTIMVLRECGRSPCAHLGPIRIRMADIDAPEKGQPGGLAARDALAAMVMKRRIEVHVRGTDMYGRLVAFLRQGQVNVNQRMLQLGMAWEYSWRHHNHEYITLQDEARAAHLGLWQEVNPMPPWKWRKQHPVQHVPRRSLHSLN